MERDSILEAGSQSIEYLEKMYQLYLANPYSIDASYRSLFASLEAPAVLEEEEAIRFYRHHGHLWAQNNPLSLHKHPSFKQPQFAQVSPKRLEQLQKTYCGSIGVEYMDRRGEEFEKWLQERIEPTFFKTRFTIEQKKKILHYLNKSELFELFLHTKYVGQKRFSIEGAETLIPMLALLIERAAQREVSEFVLGMSHRGRLNVLANILDKSYRDVFNEFDPHYIPNSFEGSGDVKYHKGFEVERAMDGGKRIKIYLLPNPSHLESVDPVVEGFTKASQVLVQSTGSTLPILIHGDAALSGQGVVYETLQMRNLDGYSTGGTIHLVVNNQIGFTTLPQEGRSTLYCTDIAKAFNDPVFHVNAEDPEACVFAALLAIEIRQTFGYDVWIDLLSYRKYGHNESDEPAFTQPLEYQIIREKKPIRELYRDELIGQGVVERTVAEELEKEFKGSLQKALEEESPKKEVSPKRPSTQHPPAVSLETLQLIGKKICSVPEGFHLHDKLKLLMKERLKMVVNAHLLLMNWGMAELLAYGTLLWEGIAVRLSGQDCARGTFSHRHALWVDQEEENSFIPLKHLKEEQGRFDLYNSPLSEYGALAFEYGYSLYAQEALVLWEAQFGDFCNGAQIVIDQYLSSAEQKWGKSVRLVLLLPHGYEGQGPEHSSARMERFLSLSGNENWFVCNPSTPAQFFHLLRRQAYLKERKPLIAFTPKVLLRHALCISCMQELSTAVFEEVLEEQEPVYKAQKVAVCSGKMYYELFEERKRRGEEIALIRIEQLYPFPQEKLKKILAKYTQARQFFWAQEEPENMGAWSYVRPILSDLVKNVAYAGRARSASPATGSYAVHQQELGAIFSALFFIH